MQILAGNSTNKFGAYRIARDIFIVFIQLKAVMVQVKIEPIRLFQFPVVTFTSMTLWSSTLWRGSSESRNRQFRLKPHHNGFEPENTRTISHAIPLPPQTRGLNF